MAANRSFSPSAVLVGLAGVLVAAALASSPLYLARLSSPEQALEQEVSGPVEIVRRAVLNVEPGLCALADMAATPGAKPDPTGKMTDKIQEKHRTIFQASTPVIEGTSRQLRAVIAEDEKRGIVWMEHGVPAGAPPVGAPNVRNSYADMQTKYRPEWSMLLRETEQALRTIASISNSAGSGTSTLQAGRMKALLYAVKGTILRNRAEFEAAQTMMLRDAALARLTPALAWKRAVESAEASKPSALQAQAKAAADAYRAARRQVGGAIAQLQQSIDERKSSQSQLQDEAARANAELAQLLAVGRSDDQARLRILELSSAARKAEAQAAALLRGTLEGAELVPPGGPDPEPPRYRGGQREPGIEELEMRLAGLKAQAAILDELIEGFEQQQSAVADTIEKLSSQQAKLVQRAESQRSRLTKELQAAELHSKAADEAAQEAAKAYEEASRAVSAAIAAAKKRAADARQSAQGTTPPDERLSAIANDTETEASLQCLAAEIGYGQALLDHQRLMARQSLNALAGRLAMLSKDAKPPAPTGQDVEALRTSTVAHAEQALKHYEQAANLIGRTSVRAGATTVSGKNLLWQVQLGQAAGHLLLSGLAEKPAQRLDHRKQAYDLLVDAAKGREQSPLLASALDAIAYLQQSPN